MEISQLFEYIRISSSFLTYLLLSIIFLNRNLNQYKEAHQWNWARFLIFMVMASLLLTPVIRIILIFNPALQQENIYSSSNEMGLFTIIACLPILFGLMFLAYINIWKYFLYLPLFYFIVAMIFYTQTGISSYIIYFNYVGGIIGIIGLLEVGIRLRDNNSMGIAFYFILIFAAFLVNSNFALFTSLTILQNIYGFYYALDKVKIFKDEEEQQEEFIDDSNFEPTEEEKQAIDAITESKEITKEVVPVFKLSDILKNTGNTEA